MNLLKMQFIKVRYLFVFNLFLLFLLSGCNSAIFRVIHYGDADINDFKKFPSRELNHSQNIFSYPLDTGKHLSTPGFKSKNEFETFLQKK